MIRNTSNEYGSVAKFFHWVIFLLLLVMIIFGFLLDEIPKEYQGIAYNTHKLTGLVILFLMLLRGLWALSNPKPALPLGTPSWQRSAEYLLHSLLYAVVIAMPLSGWIGSSAAGHPPYIGDFQFNLPVPQDKGLVDTCFEIHEYLAFTLIALVSVHVLAALYHHFIVKDNILRRMLPRRR